MADKEKKQMTSKSRKKRIKKVAVSVILIACITVVVVFNVMNKNDDTKTTTVTKENTAKKGNLTVGITESGTMESGSITQAYELDTSSVGSSSSSASGAGSSSSRLGNSTVGSDGSSSSSTSTTAYLERKAKEDARDHAQEKREEQARLHQETGGRMVGVRYYEWDSIPKGNRVVKCSYCGAENLISERYKPNRYTCYFCREILE